MNEQLKELAYQSGLLSKRVFDDSWVSNPKLEAKLKKFAELIVRECLDQCYNRGMNDALYAGQLKAAAYIEEHFGVEE